MKVRKKLGEMLLEEALVTKDQLDRALAEHKKTGLRLGQYLVRQNLIKDTELTDILSRQLEIDRYRPDRYPVDPALSAVVPLEVARRHKIVPLERKGNLLTVAMVDPLDVTALDTVETMTNMEAKPVVCSEGQLNELVSAVFGSRSVCAEEPPGAVDARTEEDREEEGKVVRLVDSIIAQAVRERVSDVHISPEEKTVRLRFRIDGKLHDVPAPPRSALPSLLARIKTLARMDPLMTRIPQEGRFTVKLDDRDLRVRVSVLPTIHGENTVLRFVDMHSRPHTLEELGMAEEDRVRIEQAVDRRRGMILCAGLPGSGRTASLYALLQRINRPDINIITLEDPVEYRLEGIRQVELDRAAGITFAGGLRSILLQDPDVILVGEMEDAETAGIAARAALTGHRMLGAVHANDAAGAITRLLDMGIEPFLLSSALLVSFAQRLVRTICPSCGETYGPSPAALAAWGLDREEHADFRRGRGCPRCLNTGYRGKTGVFEVLAVDEEIREMILRSRPAAEIAGYAKCAGKFRTLKDDAAEKVHLGITTLEEAIAAVAD
ncbi:MAG TPA: ATPase, T2SS/T4P/T4SS family [Syntrophales bacterium]|nr:ATPase, T2SS/T4P/T4SS family [Syntrophales bacterium]